MRKRQHPLPDGDSREHAVDQMGCGIRHPASDTRITETSFLARIRDEAVEAALIAVHTHETPSQNATVQELAELAFNKAGNLAIAFTLSGQEGSKCPATTP